MSLCKIQSSLEGDSALTKMLFLIFFFAVVILIFYSSFFITFKIKMPASSSHRKLPNTNGLTANQACWYHSIQTKHQGLRCSVSGWFGIICSAVNRYCENNDLSKKALLLLTMPLSLNRLVVFGSKHYILSFSHPTQTHAAAKEAVNGCVSKMNWAWYPFYGPSAILGLRVTCVRDLGTTLPPG